MDNTSEARRKKIMRRKRAMLKRTHRRINVTFIIVFVLLLVLGVKIFMINYTHGEEYSQAVLNHQTYTSTTIPYMRGNITASDGTVLAYSEKVYNLILDVKSVTSEDGKYLVVRFHDYAGSSQKVTVKPNFCFRSWSEGDLRERRIGEICGDDEVTMTLHPYEIKTVLFEF